MPESPVNVAHLGSPTGRCLRCGAGIGIAVDVHETPTGPQMVERPWDLHERVIEYDCPDGRTRFAQDVVGFAKDCVP